MLPDPKRWSVPAVLAALMATTALAGCLGGDDGTDPYANIGGALDTGTLQTFVKGASSAPEVEEIETTITRIEARSLAAAEATAKAEGGARAEAQANAEAEAEASTELVTICHRPPGNPANAHTIRVGAPAADAHIQNHDDTLGACEGRDDTFVTVFDGEKQVEIDQDMTLVSEEEVQADVFDTIVITIDKVRVTTQDGCELVLDLDGMTISVTGAFIVREGEAAQVLVEVDMVDAVLASGTLEECPDSDGGGAPAADPVHVTNVFIDIDVHQTLVVNHVDDRDTFIIERAQPADSTTLIVEARAVAIAIAEARAGTDDDDDEADGDSDPTPTNNTTDGQDDKTVVCHVPPGEPENRHTIVVGNASVPAHLDHGDTLGACPEPSPPPTDGNMTAEATAEATANATAEASG